jgi:hypothetical protein
MNTTDRGRAASDTELDRDLFAAFAFEPPPEASAAADRRIGAAIAGASAGTASRRPDRVGSFSRVAGRFRQPSRRLRAVALLGAVLILVGAGRGLLGLYEGMIGSFGGWRTAWDHATVLGVSQTIDGYRVTIERAYADPNQLMLAISVNDVENRGWTQVATMYAEVTDEQGRSFGHSMGESSPDGSSVAANLAWLTPPAGLTPGHHTLHVSVPSISVRDNTTPPPAESSGDASAGDSWMPWHEIAGPWTFTIPLDVAGGVAVQPDNAATVGGTEVRLTQVTVSPTSVSATITVAGPAGAGGWSPIGQFEHAGRTYAIVGGVVSSADAPITFEAADGTTDASGAWTLRIDELVGFDSTEQVRLAGPWVLTFAIP